MANGDLAAALGYGKLAGTEDIRQGFDAINAAADFAVNVAGLRPVKPSSVGAGASIGTYGDIVAAAQVGMSANGVFDWSKFSRYRIEFAANAQSAAQVLNLRFNTSGTSDSGANYDWVRVDASGTSSTVTNGSAQSAIPISNTPAAAAATHAGVIDLIRYDSAGRLAVIIDSMNVISGTVHSLDIAGDYTPGSCDGFAIYNVSGGTANFHVQAYALR